MTPPAFLVESFQAPAMEPGTDRVDAIVAVTATESLADAGPDATLGVILATSSAMVGAPFGLARTALAEIVTGLRVADRIFVVSFATFARTAVAPAPASAANFGALDAVTLRGGAAIAQGLGAARSLFSPGPANHAVLIAARDATERPETLAVELSRCAGLFSCDCWTVGGDPGASTPLAAVAQALRGEVRSARTAEELAQGVLAGTGRARAAAVGPIRLQIDVGPSVTVADCRQISPVEATLSPGLDTGRWFPGESRDFQVSLRVPATSAGEGEAAARVKVVFGQSDASPTATVHARRP